MSKKPLLSNTILISDDEPYNLQWLVEWVESLKYNVVVVDNVDAAIERLEKNRFRAVLADLSIPLLSHQLVPDSKNSLYKTYPGLVVADFARNHDHTNRQVVVYSVHDDPLIQALAGTLGFKYLLKGRPLIVKRELEATFRYDPRKS